MINKIKEIQEKGITETTDEEEQKTDNITDEEVSNLYDEDPLYYEEDKETELGLTLEDDSDFIKSTIDNEIDDENDDEYDIYVD